jgi:hypothetical protein
MLTPHSPRYDVVYGRDFLKSSFKIDVLFVYTVFGVTIGM